MTTLIHFLSELARQPAMPLSNLDECARAAGIELTDAESDALRRRDASGLGRLVEQGPKLWCVLFPAEDTPTPDKRPDDAPQDDAPPTEPPASDKTH
ncbi:hypothetical protein [Silanimonas sp.]|jgi:hypothetical protein|uniref:hypothetical protein n=1 Tax=Silanimonas sp. TaxID=1929290 RepID=UPI0022C2C433|nr:hypothetical protein [Silanimonas sp.]MCZ8166608.1 hypothetical protein [Silanimonas sp.]